MAYYIFNVPGGPARREQAAELLRLGLWGVAADEPHRDALTAGDRVLIYLGAPQREFIGTAVLGSAVHDWTASEAESYPDDSRAGVLLAQVEEWDPPVPMAKVLSQIDTSAGARADFDTGIVGITLAEYETALAVSNG